MTETGAARRKEPIFTAADWRTIALILGIKLVIYVFAAQAFHVWADEPTPGWFGWLDIWKRWDAESYLNIAEFGYSNAEDRRYLLSFYPFYPLVVRLFAFVIRDYHLSAVLVSTLASLAAGLSLRRLVEMDYSAEVAERAVWFLFIYPTSYFLHAAYTEGLFLALVLASLLAARKERWADAGLLGALACMTRNPGILIIPTLLVEAWRQYRVKRRWRWGWLWIAMAPLGYFGYLLVNARVMGQPFAFMKIQRESFYVAVTWRLEGVQQAIGALMSKPGNAEILGRQVLIFMALALICTIVAWFKLRLTLSVWMTMNLLLLASISFVIGFPRYTLVMFPIHILFALLAENRWWYAALTVWSLVNLGLFVSMFVRGSWAF
jgi:Gpi18-like mannosyltransferase